MVEPPIPVPRPCDCGMFDTCPADRIGLCRKNAERWTLTGKEFDQIRAALDE